MADKELLTVKEYAEAVGITQQAVYKRMGRGLSPFVVEIDGQKFLKKEALEQVKQKQEAVRSEAPATEKTEYDEIERIHKLYIKRLEEEIESLKADKKTLETQLTTKDAQIKDLSESLKQALNVASQTNFLSLQAQNKPTEATEPADISEVERTAAEPTEKPQEAKKGLFSWFSRNK